METIQEDPTLDEEDVHESVQKLQQQLLEGIDDDLKTSQVAELPDVEVSIPETCSSFGDTESEGEYEDMVTHKSQHHVEMTRLEKLYRSNNIQAKKQPLKPQSRQLKPPKGDSATFLEQQHILGVQEMISDLRPQRPMDTRIKLFRKQARQMQESKVPRKPNYKEYLEMTSNGVYVQEMSKTKGNRISRSPERQRMLDEIKQLGAQRKQNQPSYREQDEYLRRRRNKKLIRRQCNYDDSQFFSRSKYPVPGVLHIPDPHSRYTAPLVSPDLSLQSPRSRTPPIQELV